MAQLVMVIDDSLTVRKILEASLQRAGMDVTTFADGLEAMQALTQRTTPVPQLVLLDVGLPKVDGYQVARTLRHHPGFAQTPIIMLSSHTSRLDKMRARLAGASGYLTKPFQPAEVLAVIQAHLGGPSGAPVQ
jgi:twitching motility two-component system response regulator PilG